MSFTKEEISTIEKELNFLTSNWHKSLVNQVITLAKRDGIKDLYWNSSETLNSGATQEGKVDFFYERLPSQMGFKKVTANLRGKPERMWHMSLSKEAYASEGLITLDKVPPAYQGAVIGITRHRGPYTKDELKKVFETIKKKKEQGKEKEQAKGFYYTEDKTWSGAQKFVQLTEKVIEQRLSSSTLSGIIENGSSAVKKFLSFILSQQQHFGQDVIGWALVSPLSKDVWVINQIQTDNLNKYLKVKSEVLNKDSYEDKAMDIQTISDMLHARDKSVWIEKLQDETFLQAIQRDPENSMRNLPTNLEVEEAGGIAQWLSVHPQFIITASSKSLKKVAINTNKHGCFNLKKYKK